MKSINASNIFLSSGRVRAVAVTPDGKHVVSGSSDETIKLWDIKICECNRCHKKTVAMIVFVFTVGIA